MVHAVHRRKAALSLGQWLNRFYLFPVPSSPDAVPLRRTEGAPSVLPTGREKARPFSILAVPFLFWPCHLSRPAAFRHEGASAKGRKGREGRNGREDSGL